MEVVSPSEMLVNIYKVTCCNIPDDSHLHACCHENLKSQKFVCHTLKMFCGRLAPRTGGAIGHAETASVTVARTQGRPHAVANRRSAGVSLTSQLMGMSRDGKTHLQILCQPEQQHRARYQTEGSRGAVKDRSGNGFPVVKVVIHYDSQ